MKGRSVESYNSVLISSNMSIVRHLKILRLFGLSTLIIDPPSFSKISYAYLLVSLAVFVASAVKEFHPALEWREAGALTLVLINTKKIGVIVGPAVITCRLISTRFLYEKLVNDLISVQRALGTITYKMFTSIKIVCALIGLVFLGFFVIRIIRVAFDGDGLIWALADVEVVVINVFAYLSLLQFIYLARCIGDCFSKLGQHLAESALKMSLTDYVRTHNHLMDLSAELNTIFDASITLTLFFGFVSTLTTISMFITNELTETLHKIRYYSYITIPTSMVLLVLETCQTVASQAEESNQRLLNFRIYKKPQTSEDDLLLIHYSGRKPLTFKAFNALTVNYNLGVSMIAAFLTYVVVLFQSG
ncbi:Hypothetical protein NTJ_14483 [Nesidiocoris tenuis]|uniref:Gustatory receptor n=1 Tax=Nesidiocoris tenuis TaxID=355587 RepID=A0ABN7BBA5_9HEMI|nr:Hypothetical protein NTJ_14483 [Nesidiocoris tenuis]